jgi:hypothetical protein
MTFRWLVAALAAVAISMMALPSAHVVATAPPDTVVATTIEAGTGPVATNDLLPDQNSLTDCIGSAEPANCGSKARADGHTYLVFIALAAGLAFIGWRITRGVKARDRAGKPAG